MVPNMKWHIYNADNEPLYYDAMLLEFDTKEAAQRFIDSDSIDADFYADAHIEHDILFVDGAHLNATNLIMRDGELWEV